MGCILYIIIKCENLSYSITDLLKVVIGAGLIQALICICMILSPEFKRIIVSFMYRMTNDTIYLNVWHYNKRFYGFANNLLDTFGYGTGIIASLALFLAFNKKISYLLLLPPLILVPFMNSRSGLVIFSIGLLIAIPDFLVHCNRNTIIKGIFLFFTLFIVLNILIFYLKKNEADTFTWVVSGTKDIFKLFQGQSGEGSLKTLFSKQFWNLPSGIRLLTGTGHSLYDARGFMHSDVGYINDIWLVGIIGMFFLYFPYINLLFKAFIKGYYGFEKCIVFFLFIALFVFNIKTFTFAYNTGTAITLLIIFYVNYKIEN